MTAMMIETAPTTGTVVFDAVRAEGVRKHVKRATPKRNVKWENTSRMAPVELIREGDYVAGLWEMVTDRRLVFGHVMLKMQLTGWIDAGQLGRRLLIDTLIVPGVYDPILLARDGEL